MDVKIAVISLFLTIIGGTWYLASRLTAIESVAIDAKVGVHELNDEMGRRVDEANAIHSTFITRAEFMAWLNTPKGKR